MVLTIPSAQERERERERARLKKTKQQSYSNHFYVISCTLLDQYDKQLNGTLNEHRVSGMVGDQITYLDVEILLARER